MNIDGYTRVCGLIGNPVEHTLSPVIHNTLAEAFGENLVYVPLRVPEGRVGEAVEGAWALNFLGLNVTVPYKSQVLPFLREIDPLAEAIGAVNTLVRTEGGFKGYNTDMPGLYRAMCGDGVKIEGERVLILGAGGAARAAAILAARKKASRIVIMNRTPEKAQRLAEEVNRLAGRAAAEALSSAEHEALPGDGWLAVQTTNVGMFPKTGRAVIEDRRFYEKIHTGYDLVFNPARTRFMELVEESGGRAFGGLKMLLFQGVISYELWTGAQVGEALSGRIYEKMRKAMGI